MTIEKLKELLQIRVDYFEQHLTDEAMTAQLKAYTANLGTVPDEVAEPAFWAAIGKCRYPKQFLVDWQDAVREIMRKRLPSDAALWSETMDAAHRISDCYAVHTSLWAVCRCLMQEPPFCMRMIHTCCHQKNPQRMKRYSNEITI